MQASVLPCPRRASYIGSGSRPGLSPGVSTGIPGDGLSGGRFTLRTGGPGSCHGTGGGSGSCSGAGGSSGPVGSRGSGSRSSGSRRSRIQRRSIPRSPSLSSKPPRLPDDARWSGTPRCMNRAWRAHSSGPGTRGHTAVARGLGTAIHCPSGDHAGTPEATAHRRAQALTERLRGVSIVRVGKRSRASQPRPSDRFSSASMPPCASAI